MPQNKVTGKTQTSLHLPPDLYEALREVAHKERTTQSLVIERALRQDEAIRKELGLMTQSRLTNEQDRYQIWDGLVGSQTAQEFWEESKTRGAMNYREAAEDYIEHLRETAWTDDIPIEDDIATMTDMLAEVMVEQVEDEVSYAEGAADALNLYLSKGGDNVWQDAIFGLPGFNEDASLEADVAGRSDIVVFEDESRCEYDEARKEWVVR